ncbi:MAG: hypothetical protein ACYC2T_09015 [Bacillota bacterium]
MSVLKIKIWLGLVVVIILSFSGYMVFSYLSSGYSLTPIAAAKSNSAVGKDAVPFGEIDFVWCKVILFNTANGSRTVEVDRYGLLWHAPGVTEINNSTDIIRTVGWMSLAGKQGQVMVFAVESSDPNVAYIEVGPSNERIRKEIKMVTPVIFSWKKVIQFNDLKPVALSKEGNPLYEYKYPENKNPINAPDDLKWYPIRASTPVSVGRENLSGLANREIMPQQMPSNFQFVLKYGVGAKNVLDTSKETFTKDLVIAGTATTKLRLTPGERQTIYKQMRNIDILSYPEVIKPVDGLSVTPNVSYSLTISFGNIKKSIYWDGMSDLKGQRSVELRNLINNIMTLIESKKEYKKLPPAQGGYA